MDVEVIDVGEGSGNQAMSNGGDAEPGEGEVNSSGNPRSRVGDGVSEPYVGMEFDSEDAAKTFYCEYARRLGFSSKAGPHGQVKADGTNMYCEFVCGSGREGLKRKLTESCDAMIRIEQKGQNKWVVTKFVKEHSHSMVIPPSKVNNLQPRRHFSSVGRLMPETYQGVGLVPSGIMYVSMDVDHISSENIHGIRNNPAAAVASKTSHPVKNLASMNYTVRQPIQRKPIQKRTLGRDAQNLLEYFKKVQAENPGFFYAIQLDEDNHMSNVFWADARSRTAYSHFGDAVTLDTTYRVNQYGVPFAPFTGVNHHGQMILFGCALLLDDSEASFVWLFKTFLAAMNDHHPVSITTNQDRAIQTAVSQVFPQARHCLSKWHVLREGPVKLAHVCHMHPNFEIDLYNCINLTETTEEFDSSWNSIIDKYELRGNDWLQSLYSTRAQWVPAYFRDSFFAVMSPNQGYGSYFIDGFVNQHTTLPMFFRQYELAVERWFEKEIESDFETICVTPVLKTPSPMEKQAADLYTRKIFLKFQEELVETFAYTANRIEEDGANSIFRVAKFEDDQKSYTVTLNYSELRANCSCQMFEYSGILCRHVLTVFTVSNVLTLPSHYILKRWTRNAKSSVASDESASVSHKQESLTSRYTSLCREAIRYAEKGAIAVETYDAAMSALKEGGNKVAVMKRSIAKVSEKKTPTSTSDTTPLLWPPKDETTGYTDLCQEPIKYAEEETIAVETYDAAMSAVREVGKKIPVTKRSIAKAPPSHLVVENAHAEKETPTSTSDTTPLLWRQKDETRRYTNLWQEPIKYAEEGTVAVESYDAAMSAVREIGKKIPVTKRSIAKVAPPNHLVGGNAHAEKETPNSTSDTTPLVWRQKDETRGYTNLCQEPIKYAEEGTIAVETYDVAMSALRQGGKKIAVTKKRSIAKAAPPSHSGNAYAGRKTRTSTSHATPASTGFNLNDAGAPIQPVADLNLPQTAAGSHQRDDGPPENMEVVLPSLKSMTWAMENKDSTPENRVAVINLKLQDSSKIPSTESEVKFHLSRVSLEPILEYMAQISEQLSTTANRVAVINLKHQDTQTTSGTSGEPEVKFQVSKDALGAVLRSMTYIREQLTCDGDEQ